MNYQANFCRDKRMLRTDTLGPHFGAWTTSKTTKTTKT